MKLTEYRELCSEVSDLPTLSKFHKMFCELVLKSPDTIAMRLINSFQDVFKEIEMAWRKR